MITSTSRPARTLGSYGALLLAGLAACGAEPVPSSGEAQAVSPRRAALTAYEQAEAILEGGTLGGIRGLRVRRIGAPVSYSLNGSYVFYPASSLKVLQHLYAMTRVQGGSWNLGMNASVCTSGDNCGAPLNSQTGCAAANKSLSNTLSSMMKNSSNADTNAVQQLVGTTTFPMSFPYSLNMAGFGRSVMNQFATNTLGLTNTAINHKFGCAGYCGNPTPNTMTLVDAERIYTAIATNASVLDPAQRQTLHDLMLNESNSFLNDIIDQEAASLGKNAYKEAFRDQVYMIYKDGSWTCSGKTFRSSAGLIQLPINNGAGKHLYTWGAFTHNSEAWAYIPGTVQAAVKELLRPGIRTALQTWGPGLTLATSGSSTEAGFSQRAAQTSASRYDEVRED